MSEPWIKWAWAQGAILALHRRTQEGLGRVPAQPALLVDLKGAGTFIVAIVEILGLANAKHFRRIAEGVEDRPGYTGLSTALHLAERGLRAIVIEAGEIGHGCSGRNGGQVISGRKLLPDEVEQKYGAEKGRRLVRLSDNAPADVFDHIEKHEIDCAASRMGTIRAAIDSAGLKHVTAFAEQSARRNGPVQLLSQSEMRELTGVGTYRGGSFDPRGGHINPLGYARGLALAAQRAGASLCAHSPAVAAKKQGQDWKVETKNGAVSAAELVVATNGYTDGLWPGLRQTIMPIFTYLAVQSRHLVDRVKDESIRL